MKLGDKSILVLDKMYEKCAECPLHFEEWQKYTDSKGHKVNSVEVFCCLHRSEPICNFVDPETGKPDWCELQYPLYFEDVERWEKDEYRGGWDDAMDQIGAIDKLPWIED